MSSSHEPCRPYRRGSWGASVGVLGLIVACAKMGLPVDGQTKSRQFIVDVERTKKHILEQEDTDGDHQITVQDMGPKVMKLGSLESGGHTKYDIRGTYM